MFNLDALAAEGWHSTPFNEFILKIHSRCDLSCRYCYVYEMADSSWRAQPRKMSRDTVDQIADRISEHAASHSLDALQVILHGGEPLLAGTELIEYVVQKLRRCTSAKVDFDIQTNGVLLDTNFLKLFDFLDVHVSVSLDGDKDAHDRHRRRANGEGSHALVTRSLDRLTTDQFRHLFNGLICTIDPRNNPVDTYEALLQFGPPEIDFLLPHGNWSAPPPGRITGSKETPYGNWLAKIFDHWHSSTGPGTRVRLFGEIMRLLLGGKSTTELLGLSPVGAIVIETDGSIEQSDILKSAFQGASLTGLHVSRDSFDAALSLPSIMARQVGYHALSDTCRGCEIGRVCGGGLYAHRYNAENGFANPSVYCPDLIRIISHIREVMQADVHALRRGK